MRAREFTLLWRQGFDRTFNRRYSVPLLTSRDPYSTPDPKQQRRWRDALAMVAWLDAQQIPHDEFVAAICAYANWQARQRGLVRFALPMRQVKNAHGRELWDHWRARRIAEAAGTTQRIDAETRRVAQSEQARLLRAIAHAYRQCQHSGIDAVSYAWAPEALYLLATTEPYITPHLAAIFQRASARTKDWLRTSFARCDEIRGWLIRLKLRALGSAWPVLRPRVA